MNQSECSSPKDTSTRGSVGHPVGHPVGHHQGWPLSPWTLNLSIVGLNPMCDTVNIFFTFQNFSNIKIEVVESRGKATAASSKEAVMALKV